MSFSVHITKKRSEHQPHCITIITTSPSLHQAERITLRESLLVHHHLHITHHFNTSLTSLVLSLSSLCVSTLPIPLRASFHIPWCHVTMVVWQGVAEMAQVIYGGHCVDLRERDWVSAIAGNVLLSPDKFTKVSQTVCVEIGPECHKELL